MANRKPGPGRYHIPHQKDGINGNCGSNGIVECIIHDVSASIELARNEKADHDRGQSVQVTPEEYRERPPSRIFLLLRCGLPRTMVKDAGRSG